MSHRNNTRRTSAVSALHLRPHDPDASVDTKLERARKFALRGEDDAAKDAYVDVLRYDPTNVFALNELGALAYASGHRSAAQTTYAQAVQFHPGSPIAHINLANLLFEDADVCGARLHYQAALDIDPDFPEAHQGLARVLVDLGDEEAAAPHWQKGFAGHAIVAKRYRGHGLGVKVLLLVATHGGNVPTRHWLDDRFFAVTAIYPEFYPLAQPLPPHAFVVNAIGDADLCGVALERAEELLERSSAPVVNPPALVRKTSRNDNALRLASIAGVIAPAISTRPRATIVSDDTLDFPLLLRTPGYHTGRHFTYVADRDALIGAATALPGDELLVIQYLDARGPDGLARKYRVMIIDGVLYPLHLAIAPDWKVHYFTAAMAVNASNRDEEHRFLDDMQAVLGERAMTALRGIGGALGLDYAGADFALAPDGSVMLFEANSTMVINPVDPDQIWNYRRPAIAAALEAAKCMLFRRAKIRVTPASRLCTAQRTGESRS
jgi:glutathione synthase/RimK-type ligase-like ATP-grasp enzyme